MRRPRWQAFGGAVIVVAGIAALIEARSHHPVYYQPGEGSVRIYFGAAGSLPQTAYDLLRIGGWALVIFGGLIVLIGLIGYWGSQSRGTPEA